MELVVGKDDQTHACVCPNYELQTTSDLPLKPPNAQSEPHPPMPPIAPTKSESSRLFELDGVRGIAAIAVIYAHLFLMWIPAPNSVFFWARTASGMAWTGVVLFFVLSGFLIGGNLLRYRDAQNFFRVFYARRALRIFPLYYLLLGTYLVLSRTELGAFPSFAENSIPFWTYPLMVQNIPMAISGDWGVGVLGITWSVALEEQFYLIAPLLVRFVSARALPWTLLLLALSGPLSRHFLPLAHAPFLPLGYSEALFCGILMAWAHTWHPQLFRSRRCTLIFITIFAASGAAMGLLSTRMSFKPFNETIMTLFWGSFLWLVLCGIGQKWTAPLRARWLCGIGQISYGLYLFHTLVYFTIMIVFSGNEPTHALGWRGFAFASASALLVVALASLSFYFFERHLIRIGHGFKYRQ